MSYRVVGRQLDFETRGSPSLLNVEKLSAPFRYTLRLRNGEEKREVPPS